MASKWVQRVQPRSPEGPSGDAVSGGAETDECSAAILADLAAFSGIQEPASDSVGASPVPQTGYQRQSPEHFSSAVQGADNLSA